MYSFLPVSTLIRFMAVIHLLKAFFFFFFVPQKREKSVPRLKFLASIRLSSSLFELVFSPFTRSLCFLYFFISFFSFLSVVRPYLNDAEALNDAEKEMRKSHLRTVPVMIPPGDSSAFIPLNYAAFCPVLLSVLCLLLLLGLKSFIRVVRLCGLFFLFYFVGFIVWLILRALIHILLSRFFPLCFLFHCLISAFYFLVLFCAF